VTGTFDGFSVRSLPRLLGKSGAWIWICVPVTLTRLKNCCELSCVGSPKLTQSIPTRLKPEPSIVTTEPPSSLASEFGPPLVEIDVMCGVGT
jgi:hypothetical protein